MAQGGATSVRGEVFAVSEQELEALDALEGHPHWYRRASMIPTGGMDSETYLMARSELEGRPVLLSGDWRGRPMK